MERIVIVKVSNYNKEQESIYKEPLPNGTTIGLLAIEKKAMDQFREKYPNNNDSDTLLNREVTAEFVT